MKKVFFIAICVFSMTIAKAQKMDNYSGPMDLKSLLTNLPTLTQLENQVRLLHNGANMLPASQDRTETQEASRRARPNYDYGWTDGNCAYINHAYQHTILGIPYGDIYYVTETVGCL